MGRFILVMLLALAPIAASLAQAPLPVGHPPIGGANTPVVQHSGTVLETIDATPYVYIHAKSESGEQWLAAPATTLAKGAAIAWPDGLVMSNYHSKTLDRTFDQVLFVNQVVAKAAK